MDRLGLTCIGVSHQFLCFLSLLLFHFLTISANHSLDVHRVCVCFFYSNSLFGLSACVCVFVCRLSAYAVIALSNDVAVCKSMRFHCLHNLNVKFSLRFSSFFNIYVLFLAVGAYLWNGLYICSFDFDIALTISAFPFHLFDLSE